MDGLRASAARHSHVDKVRVITYRTESGTSDANRVITMPLPAGAREGDLMVVQLLMPGTLFPLNHRITSQTMANGAWAFAFIYANTAWAATILLVRGASMDVNYGNVGFKTTQISADTPTDVEVTPLTTTRSGALTVLYYAYSPDATPTQISHPPAFTVGPGIANAAADNGIGMDTVYVEAEGTQVQPTFGIELAQAGTLRTFLTAFNRRLPRLYLSTILPAGVVGYPYSGSVTATAYDGAEGPVTISVDSLPAGLTLGATVDNGDGSWTAQVTSA